jgi:hypothetical protein
VCWCEIDTVSGHSRGLNASLSLLAPFFYLRSLKHLIHSCDSLTIFYVLASKYISPSSGLRLSSFLANALLVAYIPDCTVFIAHRIGCATI